MVLTKGLRPLQVVSVILLVRLLSVFLVQTWYVPDEYWQTLEVAHKFTFGYGALTWEWKKGIRSYLYPSIVSALYYVLKLTDLDYPEAVIYLPRILQALISTAADYSFYKWTGGRKWALFLVLTSWFWFYTSGRTLLQTLETALVTIALSVFPFKSGRQSYYDVESPAWVWLAVVSLFVRPTSAPLWGTLAVYALLTTNQGPLKLILRTYVPISLIVGGLLVALDSYFHGSFIVTPFEFFRFNVIENIASFYGTHPWHWYLWQGVPCVAGTALPPALVAAARVLRRPAEHPVGTPLVAALAIYIAAYSFIPHKEFRFMLPTLPLFLYLAQDVIVPWSRKATKIQLYTAALAIFICNAIPAVYFSSVHQSGTTSVMPIIRQAVDNRSSVAFLMPCHSTPLYSHLHVNVSTRYLSCEPPFNRPGETYEAEAFFNNPQRWWRNEYSTRQTPTLVVFYDKLKGRIDNLLSGYTLLHELPHTQFPEGEVGEKVLVYQKDSRPKPTAPVDDVI